MASAAPSPGPALSICSKQMALRLKYSALHARLNLRRAIKAAAVRNLSCISEQNEWRPQTQA